MLSALRRERAGRGEVERLAGEQAALRRVAALVARGAAPGVVFAAVAEEAGYFLPEAGQRPGRLNGIARMSRKWARHSRACRPAHPAT
jgi:hypothetical protein